ncbi:MAG: hypothetical protein ACO3C1_01925 [Ilumatobacteraceae bacterium]
MDDATEATSATASNASPPAPSAVVADAAAADGGHGDDPAAAASGLPLPPADAVTSTHRRARRRRQQRPGDLTANWATALGCAWLLGVVSLAAVWVSSRTTGLSTWWLGPEARPASPVVTALPFVLPLLAVLAAFGGMRRASWIGVAASLATAAIAIGDLGRVAAYGGVELTVAAATLLVSVASFAGMYRAESTVPSDEPDPTR